MRKKFSRKEIKEDKLVTFYYKSISYFNENRKNLLIGLGAVAIVVLAVFLYAENKKNNNEKANVELSRVLPLYDGGSFLEAIEGRPRTPVLGLKKIVEEYGNTEMGEVAKIYLANAYYFLGKFDEAMKYYEDYGGGNDLFKSTALAGQAACYEAKDNSEKAAELYKKAASITNENVLNPQYLLYAGINFIKLGKNDEAKEVLESAKKNYTASAYLRDVDRYLAQIQ